jgi:hypothetical protein
MKTAYPKILVAVLLVFAPPYSLLGLGQGEKQVRIIFPTLTEITEYWHAARVVLDVTIPETKSRVVCGSVGTFGPFCFLCLRVEREGTLIMDTYFRSRDYSDPKLVEYPGSYQITMPSGFVLLELGKNRAPEPTSSTSSRQAPTVVTPPVGLLRQGFAGGTQEALRPFESAEDPDDVHIREDIAEAYASLCDLGLKRTLHDQHSEIATLRIEIGYAYAKHHKDWLRLGCELMVEAEEVDPSMTFLLEPQNAALFEDRLNQATTEFVRQHLGASLFAQISSSYHLLENAEKT